MPPIAPKKVGVRTLVQLPATPEPPAVARTASHALDSPDDFPTLSTARASKSSARPAKVATEKALEPPGKTINVSGRSTRDRVPQSGGHDIPVQARQAKLQRHAVRGKDMALMLDPPSDMQRLNQVVERTKADLADLPPLDAYTIRDFYPFANRPPLPTRLQPRTLREYISKFINPGTFTTPMNSLIYHYTKHNPDRGLGIPKVTVEEYINTARQRMFEWQGGIEGYQGDARQKVGTVSNKRTHLVFTAEGKILSFRDRALYGGE